MFNFLNIELTSRCNKSCWMCGRRKMEIEYPELCSWGDMPFDMLEAISRQVPRGTVVQFHNNGEPTLYPRLRDAFRLFPDCIKQFNTNGKLLVERAHEIIGAVDVLTVSVVKDDPEGEEQIKTVEQFLRLKKNKRPQMVYRLLGGVDNGIWELFPGMVVRRVLHDARGSFCYEKKVVLPETGICNDLLTRLSIDRRGDIFLCVRFDPGGSLKIGNVLEMSLRSAWESKKRRVYIKNHVNFRRDLCPGCDKCEYYGIPRG